MIRLAGLRIWMSIFKVWEPEWHPELNSRTGGVFYSSFQHACMWWSKECRDINRWHQTSTRRTEILKGGVNDYGEEGKIWGAYKLSSAALSVRSPVNGASSPSASGAVHWSQAMAQRDRRMCSLIITSSQVDLEHAPLTLRQAAGWANAL